MNMSMRRNVKVKPDALANVMLHVPKADIRATVISRLTVIYI